MYNASHFVFILGMTRRVIVKGNSAAEFVANETKDESFLGVRLLSKNPLYYNGGECLRVHLVYKDGNASLIIESNIERT